MYTSLEINPFYGYQLFVFLRLHDTISLEDYFQKGALLGQKGVGPAPLLFPSSESDCPVFPDGRKVHPIQNSKIISC